MNPNSFLKKFEDEAACLDYIKDIKYPNGIFCKKCQQISKFYKVRSRPVYQCSCGYQIAPLTGTIFEKTTTPLKYWFQTFLLLSRSNDISAKSLQRELGVTYKTAWRMLKRIKDFIDSVSDYGENGRLLTLNGIVEVGDEGFRLE